MPMTSTFSPQPVAAVAVEPRTVAGGGVRTRRILAAIVAIGAASVLGLAAWLEPSEAGLGTHEQLNMPSCGWITLMDLPCPTCGMTTSFAHAADGRFLASFVAQPLGFLLAIATTMALFVAVYVVFTGSRVAGQFTRLWVRGSGWALTAIIVAAWVYKVISYKGLSA